MSLRLEIQGNMFIAIVFFPGCDIINFEINLIFLIKPFFVHDQKVKKKKLNILRTERAFKIKQKAFFIIFKTFIKASKPTFLEGESPTLSKEMSNIYLKVTIEKKN